MEKKSKQETKRLIKKLKTANNPNEKLDIIKLLGEEGDPFAIEVILENINLKPIYKKYGNAKEIYVSSEMGKEMIPAHALYQIGKPCIPYLLKQMRRNIPENTRHKFYYIFFRLYNNSYKTVKNIFLKEKDQLTSHKEKENYKKNTKYILERLSPDK